MLSLANNCNTESGKWFWKGMEGGGGTWLPGRLWQCMYNVACVASALGVGGGREGKRVWKDASGFWISALKKLTQNADWWRLNNPPHRAYCTGYQTWGKMKMKKKIILLKNNLLRNICWPVHLSISKTTHHTTKVNRIHVLCGTLNCTTFVFLCLS